MNNQIPYGFMPPFNSFPNEELRILNERIDNLEKVVRKLEKKVARLESFPTPGMPNNYMM